MALTSYDLFNIVLTMFWSNGGSNSVVLSASKVNSRYVFGREQCCNNLATWLNQKYIKK